MSKHDRLLVSVIRLSGDLDGVVNELRHNSEAVDGTSKVNMDVDGLKKQ